MFPSFFASDSLAALARAGSHRSLVVAVACLWALGCPAAPEGPLVRAMKLPAAPAALLAVADAALGEPPDYERALAAASRAFELEPRNDGAARRAARAAFELADAAAGKDDILRYARASVGFAEKAISLRSTCGECHYVMAMSLGLVAQASTTSGALELVRRVSDHLRRAHALEPLQDDAGPQRVLGLLLVRAPPWPTSIGDLDEGTKLLRAAVARFPESPLNRLFLAEAYMRDRKYDDARSELRRVLAAPREGRWARVGGRWRREAKKLMRRISLREREDD